MRGGILTADGQHWKCGEIGIYHKIFAELEVHAELESGGDDVVRPCSEVHVANRASR
jgi:hypothetical protein